MGKAVRYTVPLVLSSYVLAVIRSKPEYQETACSKHNLYVPFGYMVTYRTVQWFTGDVLTNHRLTIFDCGSERRMLDHRSVQTAVSFSFTTQGIINRAISECKCTMELDSQRDVSLR